MNIQDLPGELIIAVFSLLDYRSLAAVQQTSKFLRHYASDEHVWKRTHQLTFSPGREVLCKTHARDCAERIEALREFIVRGTNDYAANRVRTMFTEMSPVNAQLVAGLLERSNHSLTDILFQGQGYALSSRKRICPRYISKSTVNAILHRHQDRIQTDPRSQVYLVRMLLARHTGYKASAENPEIFLLSAHLIVYDSIANPLFHFPPLLQEHTNEPRRYHLRSDREDHASKLDIADHPGPVINWGVVETIYSLVKLYRDRMSEAIPHFLPARDDYESDIPMSKCMFDADLSGNWRGLYGYLDFRELEALSADRAFSPDYFDGIQSLRINEEEISDASSDDSLAGTERHEFTADGHSMHGEFHIHGSTYSVPGLEPGFKIVKFDDMYNADGVMPWIMSGIHVPSIGIIGRWRDRTEAPGEGVEGPYVLWRDRVKDKHEDVGSLKTYHLPRDDKLGYVVIEERK